MIRFKIKKRTLSEPLILKYLIILFLSGCSEAQISIKNDLTKRELKGSVKFVDVFYYHVMEKSNSIIKTKGGKIDYFSFNDSGNLTESKSFNGNEYKEIADFSKFNNTGNSLESNKNKDYNLRLRCVFNYDKNNKLIEEIRYDSKGNETNKTNYEYGINEELIKVKFSDPSGAIRGQTMNKYDENSKLIEKISYGQKYTYEYDINGNLIQENYISAKQKYNYKYNSNNKVLEVTKYNSSDIVLFNEKYSYDRKKRLTKKINTFPNGDKYELNYIYDGNNLVEESTTFTWRDPSKYIYEYDKIGNWIKKYKYENNVCLYLWERKITYFN